MSSYQRKISKSNGFGLSGNLCSLNKLLKMHLENMKVKNNLMISKFYLRKSVSELYLLAKNLL